jgi:hypothetical protein
VIKAIPDVPGVEGVEFVPELKKVYTSNAGDNTIGVVDLQQMKVIKKLSTEAKPDGSAYAAPFHKLYVSSAVKQGPSLMCRRTRSSRRTSTVRQECRNTIQSRARSTSTCKTKTSLRSSIRRLTRWSGGTAWENVRATTGWHSVDKDTHWVYAPEQEVDGRPAARMTVCEAVTGAPSLL